MTASHGPVVSAPSLRAIFQGTLYNGIERFCNIKYANIPRRFELPQLKTSWSSNTSSPARVDCSHQGPICPQATPYKDSLIGIKPDNVVPFDLVYDELECLQLMITRPCIDYEQEQRRIPVVVWIHGGGNMAGTPYRHVCNPTDWVKRGVETGKPFIFVSVQYRVHLFGFLPFKGVGNFGLHDQRAALEWVQKYVHYFGGDAENVTLMGQSAGSCCVANHICAESPLFRRAALMSGSIESMPALPLEAYDHKAQKLAEAANLASVEELQSVSWETLVKAASKIGMEVALPADDGIFMDKGKYGRLSSDLANRLDSLLVSDCIEDAYFFEEYFPKDSETIYELAKESLGVTAKDTEALLTAYDINETNAKTRICDVLTDSLFCYGNECTDVYFRNETKTKVYRQLFDATNPFSPEFGNNHMVEILYLFNAYGVPQEKLSTTRSVQDRWIDFFQGQDPWKAESILYVSPEGAVSEMDWSERARHRRLEQFGSLEGLNREFVAQICSLN